MPTPAPPLPTPPPLSERLQRIYGPRAGEAHAAIAAATAGVAAELAAKRHPPAPRWTERDVVLITYADLLRSEGRSPLATLGDWLRRERLDQLLSTVHLLPFCPYSSDDGFSVIDYLAVDPAAGTWADIATLGESFDLMFDLVLNHISEHSAWFQAYLRGEPPYDRFFIEVDPAADLSAVTRPRPGPPWKEFDTPGGVKRVWSTFSDGATKDQMDLNYAEPTVLAEMLRVLLEYARRGARIIRLDAVAFLWKEIGTPSMHLPQTHEVVKLCRDVLARHAPRTLVLTETNVPHAENVSYFGAVAQGVDAETGAGDEAHMVYNFSLPPLLLDAFVSGDATAIRPWLANLEDPPTGCTYFNFTASHDGIGLRPVEGLLSDDRLARITAHVTARGGKVNMRARPDGSESPYELNITYVDALAPGPTNPPPPPPGGARGGGDPGTSATGIDASPGDRIATSGEPGPGFHPHPGPPPEADGGRVELHARRFLASQAVMLAVRGMPAVYFHSLVGTQNDQAGVAATGQNRRINRHKYTLGELDTHLAGPVEGEAAPLARRIYDGYRELLALRVAQPALHPDAPQAVIDVGATPNRDAVLAFTRTSLDGKQTLLVAVNFSMREQTITPGGADAWRPLTPGATLTGGRLTLPPGGFAYLVA